VLSMSSFEVMCALSAAAVPKNSNGMISATMGLVVSEDH
jgi:hypothetical protein